MINFVPQPEAKAEANSMHGSDDMTMRGALNGPAMRSLGKFIAPVGALVQKLTAGQDLALAPQASTSLKSRL